ncbi:hypothetical protein KJ611_00710 [Patescibacteria group bacterium]|nr:hypothetical protein [Patescibacteria group bacterium]
MAPFTVLLVPLAFGNLGQSDKTLCILIQTREAIGIGVAVGLGFLREQVADTLGLLRIDPELKRRAPHEPCAIRPPHSGHRLGLKLLVLHDHSQRPFDHLHGLPQGIAHHGRKPREYLTLPSGKRLVSTRSAQLGFHHHITGLIAGRGLVVPTHFASGVRS